MYLMTFLPLRQRYEMPADLLGAILCKNKTQTTLQNGEIQRRMAARVYGVSLNKALATKKPKNLVLLVFSVYIVYGATHR